MSESKAFLEVPADVIFFDCDSTLSSIEGIDVLANWRGVGAESKALTDSAMAGTLPLESVWEKRLHTVKPGVKDLARLGEAYIESATEGAIEIVATLMALDKEVHIVSGGILESILPFAEFLNIDKKRVHAVSVLMDDMGAFKGFDRRSPLFKNGGKVKTCRDVLNSRRGVMVGDGITDLEAREVCVRFVGYGGVIIRDLVRDKADFYVDDHCLTRVLPFLVTEREWSKIAS